MWDAVIRAKKAGMMLPVLEAILSELDGAPIVARALLAVAAPKAIHSSNTRST